MRNRSCHAGQVTLTHDKQSPVPWINPSNTTHVRFSYRDIECDLAVIFFLFFFFSAHFYFPASGQAVVTGVIPSPPRFLPSIFIAHRVQQSHCSSIVHRMLLTHALALYASQFVHKKKSQRIYTSMHSAGLELTKLTYTRLEDNLIRHRGDRLAPGLKRCGEPTCTILTNLVSGIHSTSFRKRCFRSRMKHKSSAGPRRRGSCRQLPQG